MLPRLGCAGIVTHNDSVLMTRRAKEDAYGKWVLPGGKVEYGESLEDTLIREIREECGIDILVKNQHRTYPLIIKDGDEVKDHRVITYYFADYVSGELMADSDALEAKFLTRDEIKSIIENKETTPLMETVLKDTGWAG